ncbi:MAG: hypothetical protein ACRELF_20670, partial [Gemmataceae bacterium]
VLLVDGKQFLFGEPNPSKAEYGFDRADPPGKWMEMKGELKGELAGRPRKGRASSWWLPGRKLKVTQEAEIVEGPQSRRLDTCLVRYVLTNSDTKEHRVGIRFMLDTFIGANDGVPFTIPGESGLCDTKKLFDSPKQVPDFIEALERGDPRDPGTVAYLQFRVSSQIESPSRLFLGGWPNPQLRQKGGLYRSAEAQLTGWNVPEISIKEHIRLNSREALTNDSTVTMYWSEQTLAPGKSRTVGFAYGLGSADTGESGGHLQLTVGGRLVRRGEFTLTAVVHDPNPGEKLTLELPSGIERVQGDEKQTVPPVPADASRPESTVTWRLRAAEDGKYELTVRSSIGKAQKKKLLIRTHGMFD